MAISPIGGGGPLPSIAQFGPPITPTAVEQVYSAAEQTPIVAADLVDSIANAINDAVKAKLKACANKVQNVAQSLQTTLASQTTSAMQTSQAIATNVQQQLASVSGGAALQLQTVQAVTGPVKTGFDPPSVYNPAPGPICFQLTELLVTDIPSMTMSGGLTGSGADCTLQAVHWRLAGPFPTQDMANSAKTGFAIGTQGNYYFPQTWNYPGSSGWWIMATYHICQPCNQTVPCQSDAQCPPGTHWDSVLCACVLDSGPPPPPSCPQGQHWDATLGQCVADSPPPPPPQPCPCPPGMLMRIYSDATWSVEFDPTTQPELAALIPGLLSQVQQEYVVADDEWTKGDIEPVLATKPLKDSWS